MKLDRPVVRQTYMIEFGMGERTISLVSPVLIGADRSEGEKL